MSRPSNGNRRVTNAARGIVIGIVLGSVCWLMIAVAGCAVLRAWG